MATRDSTRQVSQLAFQPAAASLDSGGHTLICVFLRGGADTANLLVPYADDAYYRQRPNIAIKRPGPGSEAAIRLDDHYGLHPAMRPLEKAFKEGRFGAVQAVGLDNTSGSHFECQDQMEHGETEDGPPAGGGWLGRFLRARSKEKQSPLSAVAIGTALPESLRGAPSASVLERLSDIAIKAPKGDPAAVASSLRALYGADVSLLGERGRDTLKLFHQVAELQNAAYAPENGASYATDAFAGGLCEIARLVKARVGLRFACIDLGGWDTHFFQGAAGGLQAEKIRTLAEGLAALDRDLSAHRSAFTVMITTEFGRRLYENASAGTDHGRGFALMALGNRVHGGKVLGGWPAATMDEANPLGPSGLKPEVDFRRVFAEALRATQSMSKTEGSVVFPGANLEPLGLFSSETPDFEKNHDGK
jgi:uncharacterized protein (DUF1501 family)